MNVEVVKAITPIILAVSGTGSSVYVLHLAVQPSVDSNKFNALTYVATALGTGGVAAGAGASQTQKSQNIDTINEVKEIK